MEEAFGHGVLVISSRWKIVSIFCHAGLEVSPNDLLNHHLNFPSNLGINSKN